MIDVSSTDTQTTEAVAEPVTHVDAEPEAAAPEPVAEAPVLEAPFVEAPVVDAKAAAAKIKSIKSSKFLADLTKAMQATAEAARDETLERFAADAKTATERVQADAAQEITELRRSADEDVAAIRERSKAEIARIREETEARINARKSYLEGELEEHAGVIEHRVELISASVTAFEAQMAAFCERLFAEGDPATFAALAEQLPEPPSLDATINGHVALIGLPVVDVVPDPEVEAEIETPAEAVEEVSPEATVDVAEATNETEAAPEATNETQAPESSADVVEATAGEPAEGDDPRIAMLGLSPDFAAAEAEAEMSAAETDPTEDAGDDTNQEIPTIAEEVVAARLAGLVPPSDAGDPSERLTTRVIVSGLVSVASIAAFKRGVARTHGVASVGVTSGPDGEFVFMVSHNPTVDLKEVIPELPGFGARVTGDSEDGFVVSARDPEAHA